jgi:Holliday junction resolvase RusA-like endonuclease
MIHLIIPGDPVAQARARFSTRNGYLRAYDPKSSANYKKYIITIANQINCKPMDGALVMKVDIFRSIPKSWPKKKQEQALAGIVKPIIKPDCSNYLKGIEDALNGIAYHDDSQLVLVHVTKRYAAEPRAEIRIWSDDDELNDKYINGRGND